MPGQPFARHFAGHGIEQGAGLARCAGADGVAQGNLVAAHGIQLAGHFGDLGWRYLTLVRAAEHAGNVAAHANVVFAGSLHQRREACQALGDGAVDVLLRESFGGRTEHRDFLHAGLDGRLQALHVRRQRRVSDPGLALDLREDFGGARHLWHPLGRDEAADFDIGQPGGAQVVDQTHLVHHADRLLLVLQTVTRADFHQPDLFGQAHMSSRGERDWSAHRFMCVSRGVRLPVEKPAAFSTLRPCVRA